MPAIYADTLKTTRMQAVLAAIDAGSAEGYVEIGTTGMGTILARITFDDPSGSVTDDVLNFDLDPDIIGLGLGDGIAAEARIRDSDDNDVITGLSVGIEGSGADIIVNTVSIVVDQEITATIGSITHG